MKITDLIKQINENEPGIIDRLKSAMQGGNPMSDKVKYGDTAYPDPNKGKQQSGQTAKPVKEAPISSTDDPNDPMIYGHNKANPMSLKGRIVQTRKQLRELAAMAESDELIVWEQICKLAKGGMFMGLEQNLEQIRHGINELAAKRKKGGVQSRGIDKRIGE